MGDRKLGANITNGKINEDKRTNCRRRFFRGVHSSSISIIVGSHTLGLPATGKLKNPGEILSPAQILPMRQRGNAVLNA